MPTSIAWKPWTHRREGARQQVGGGKNARIRKITQEKVLPGGKPSCSPGSLPLSIMGMLDRHIAQTINWETVPRFEVLGLDEIVEKRAPGFCHDHHGAQPERDCDFGGVGSNRTNGGKVSQELGKLEELKAPKFLMTTFLRALWRLSGLLYQSLR